MTFEQQCKVRDIRIMRGYIKLQQFDYYVPRDIINLCVKYYYDIKEQFQNYNTKYKGSYEISNDDMVITKTSWYKISIHGNICIPSNSLTKHKWTFRLNKLYACISFGIVINKNLSRLYSIWNNGDQIVTEYDNNNYDKNFKFKQGDTITMILNLCSEIKTLSFINGDMDKTIVLKNDNINRNTYSMAVCCSYKGDVVQLLSYNSH